MKLILTRESRPGDSPEVGWTEHFHALVDTDKPDEALATIERAVNEYVDPQRFECYSVLDHALVKCRIMSGLLLHVTLMHDMGYGLNERLTWKEEDTDEYCHVRRLVLMPEDVEALLADN